MGTKSLQILYLFLAIIFVQTVNGQEMPSHDWDAVKIRGVRFLPYPAYSGFPFLNDSWLPGKIEFTNGEIADSLNLRYSSFKDELVYYNKTIAAQIVIDKASLNGFSFTDEQGDIHLFRKQFYDGFLKGDRFFEVLYDSETDLLAFRKVSLTSATLYKNNSGIAKNMIYSKDYQFYFYSPMQGYTPVRISHNGLLAKFGQDSQKPIKRLLRKNRIRISGEESFVQAWKILEKEGFQVQF